MWVSVHRLSHLRRPLSLRVSGVVQRCVQGAVADLRLPFARRWWFPFPEIPRVTVCIFQIVRIRFLLPDEQERSFTSVCEAWKKSRIEIRGNRQIFKIHGLNYQAIHNSCFAIRPKQFHLSHFPAILPNFQLALIFSITFGLQ